MLKLSIQLRSHSGDVAEKFQRLSAAYVAVGGRLRYEETSRKGMEIEAGSLFFLISCHSTILNRIVIPLMVH